MRKKSIVKDDKLLEHTNQEKIISYSQVQKNQKPENQKQKQDNFILESQTKNHQQDNVQKTEIKKLYLEGSEPHISLDRLRSFSVSGVSDEKDLEILEHISVCDFCNETYIEMMEENLLELPTDFVENTMMQVQLIHSNKVISFKESRRKYYKYCVKVAFACACSLFLLFNIDKIYQEYTIKSATNTGVTDSFQNSYEKMKNLLIDMEDSRYEIKTK